MAMVMVMECIENGNMMAVLMGGGGGGGSNASEGGQQWQQFWEMPPSILQNEAVLKACSEPTSSKASGAGTNATGEKDDKSRQ
ncbi:hypothetical protein L1049_005874 [Liquidambar formosana]|uniref:Uncharacterized protein n=1 Tax=Liquidambar formosana TaxID=63359 RepID=A0AAP0REH8_LIQFO